MSIPVYNGILRVAVRVLPRCVLLVNFLLKLQLLTKEIGVVDIMYNI